MIVCGWNVRGCNKPLKGAWIAQFVKDNNIVVLGLLETRLTVDNLNKLMRNRFRGWKVTHNFDTIVNGRMALLWDVNRVDCSNFNITGQCINCDIECRITQKSFQCSLAYGLHTVVKRKDLWEKLVSIKPNDSIPL